MYVYYNNSMKKKVTFVITKSNWGGAQRYVFDLATALPKDEFDVTVAFGQEGLLATKLQEHGVKTYTIKALTRDVSLLHDVKSFLNYGNFSAKTSQMLCILTHQKQLALVHLRHAWWELKNCLYFPRLAIFRTA